MADRVYLDWNATAPLRPQARAVMTVALERCGNASSVHNEGRAARHAIEAAREKVASLVGADGRNVVFTSSGTEANMLALSPASGVEPGKAPCGRLLVSAVEHPSVLAGGRFAVESVERLPVAGDGRIDLAQVQRRLAELAGEGIRPLVSVMLANNETGVVQPIPEVARLVHAAGFLLHVDAVQAVGRISCDINALEADLVTVSAHKIGGPQGAGALVRRDPSPLDALIKGGGQERGMRAGTENVAAIVGFGAAADATQSDLGPASSHMTALRDRLESGLKAASPEVTIFGETAPRLPNTTLFAMAGIKAETAIIAFDLAGFAVSSGAACSSGKVQPSHVLAAMGVEPSLARGAIRVSLGGNSTESEIDRFLDAWIKLSGALLNRATDIAA